MLRDTLPLIMRIKNEMQENVYHYIYIYIYIYIYSGYFARYDYLGPKSRSLHSCLVNKNICEKKHTVYQ